MPLGSWKVRYTGSPVKSWKYSNYIDGKPAWEEFQAGFVTVGALKCKMQSVKCKMQN
jgi:hypothetical protein